MSDVKSMEEGAITTSSNNDIPSPIDDKPVQRNRQKTVFMVALVAVAFLALSLGLGFGLSGNNDNSTNTSNSLEQNGNSENVSDSNKNTNNENVDNSTVSNPLGGDNPITFASRLTAISSTSLKQTYSSCDALAKDLSALALLVANNTIEGNSWYFNQSYYIQPVNNYGSVQDGAPETSDNQQVASAPSGSSAKSVTESNYGSNNQVDGVEEGDLVQSNGEKVFVVYGEEIIVLAADTVTLTDRIKVPSTSDSCSFSYIPSMLLINNRLVVIASSYCTLATTNSTEAATDIAYYGKDTVNAYIYNTDDLSLVRTIALKGSFIAARAIGDNVHIVTSSYVDTYALAQYLDPWRQDIYGVNVTELQYREKAQEQIELHLQDYVNSITEELDCNSLQKLALFQNLDDDLSFSSALDTFATVTSFSISDGSSADSVKSVMLPGGGFSVYSSADFLVLSVQGWWVDSAATQQTYLIAYKLDGPSSNATALGTVPGYILNQFSIDHVVQDGVNYLRVASTTFEQWAEVSGVWEVATDSTSQVTILKIDDSEMTVVGDVSDLGKTGETIYSVRFLGDRGYVTTFKTSDPFYTLDLSDPSNPRKVGELEIPGYSSYLHPIGSNLLLGVGQATDANGTALGVQISLFDVSDFSNPVRIQNFADTSGSNVSSSSYSDAEYDHQAFRYLNESQLLIIPLTIYSYAPCNYTFEYPVYNDTLPSDPSIGNSTDGAEIATSEGADSKIVIDDPFPTQCYEPVSGFDGFRVYEIKPEGIEQYFSIKHDVSDWFTTCWSAAYLPSRSLVFNGDLMTMKGHTILSHDLSTRVQDATPINLDTEVSVCEPYILF
jgi:uncharacterized secreted protein with C-terminal beta-propeller domain